MLHHGVIGASGHSNTLDFIIDDSWCRRKQSHENSMHGQQQQNLIPNQHHKEKTAILPGPPEP